ncbi:MAG: glycerophosphodiester phosphodiesterase [Calditrichaceae bacterium]
MIIAHRGASYLAPENTMAAINLAWEGDADAIEVDVHLSKDNVIVVIHDENTLRTGGRDSLVADQTLKELKQLDFGVYKDKKWAGERIPTLDEVVRTVPKNKTVFIEIKCGKEIIPVLENEIYNSGLLAEQVVIIGFDRDVMRELKKALPEFIVLLLFEMEKESISGRWVPDIDEMLLQAKNAGMDGLDVLGCEYVDDDFARKVKSHDMKLYVWTVDHPQEARRLIDAGVDGITTNRPKWLKAKLFESAATD